MPSVGSVRLVMARNSSGGTNSDLFVRLCDSTSDRFELRPGNPASHTHLRVRTQDVSLDLVNCKCVLHPAIWAASSWYCVACCISQVKELCVKTNRVVGCRICCRYTKELFSITTDDRVPLKPIESNVILDFNICTKA